MDAIAPFVLSLVSDTNFADPAVSALTLAITAILTVVLMFRGQVVGGGKIIKWVIFN